MQDLVQKIVAEANINADQANKALEVVKNYVKEKFPMMAGAVDKLFEAETKQEDDFLD
jgi:hypothetical protein